MSCAGALLCRACRAHAYAVSKLCRWIERDPSLLISPLTLYSIAAPLGMPEDDTKSILSDQEMHRSSGLAGQFLSLLHRWKRSYVDEGFVDASSYLGHALLVAKEAKLAKIFIGKTDLDDCWVSHASCRYSGICIDNEMIFVITCILCNFNITPLVCCSLVILHNVSAVCCTISTCITVCRMRMRLALCLCAVHLRRTFCINACLLLGLSRIAVLVGCTLYGFAYFWL